MGSLQGLYNVIMEILYMSVIQYRSKVLVHFPRYCRGGIAVCISSLTLGKPRLSSLKTLVLPRFFAVKNTVVKNRTQWCLNSLLFPLLHRLINFNKRDVARRWFYDVIDFTWLLLSPWFTNRDFWALLPLIRSKAYQTVYHRRTNNTGLFSYYCMFSVHDEMKRNITTSVWHQKAWRLCFCHNNCAAPIRGCSNGRLTMTTVTVGQWF